ncbi:MAG: glycine cleavage system aminomethyltransferase GcvT [Gammaproteobacteria bacterium]|nr:glycine cleavage system aminomethyltransferase GcvT [Gammaproteobacteria bacterium]
MKRTSLHNLHVLADAKMVPFAGYDMPVHYPDGIIKEHLHTRARAGLFDVSHMGQIRVEGPNAASLLETLMPVDLVALPEGRQRYGLLLNEAGGILDDLMIVHVDTDEFTLVVNAACKEDDFRHVRARLADRLNIEMLDDRSLLALQGPQAAEVMNRLGCDLADMKFMDARGIEIAGIPCFATRSGYTGEDGFEISMPSDRAEELAARFLRDEAVRWVGLGARDSLRLEAGLCLYGHELTPETTPVEANLVWAISRSRRSGGSRAGGFPGDTVVLPQIPGNVRRRLVGLSPRSRAPVREGVVIEDGLGTEVGRVTSGGYSPCLGQPVCMGFLDVNFCGENTELRAVVRNKRLPIVVHPLPFSPHRYFR